MNFFGKTHIGNVRQNNQDAFLIKDGDASFVLLAVADGLGGYGHSGGEVASRMVIDALNGFAPPLADIAGRLAGLIVETSQIVFNQAEQDAKLEGMGTTVTAVIIQDGRAYWVHVGDTRLYLFRAGRLIQLTEDQNMARFLVEEGELTPEEAMTSPARNMLDQCVGLPYCEPVTGNIEVRQGDLLLLSSDGLHDEVTPESIALALGLETTVEARVISLVDAALQAGGRDNITVVAGEW